MRKINSPRSTPKKLNVSAPKQSLDATKNRTPEKVGSPIKNKKRKKHIMVPTATFRGQLKPISYTLLKEIKRIQKTDKCLIPKKPFSRLIREIIQTNDYGKEFRFQNMAMQCLQEATEVHMALWFTKLNYFAGHAKRVTVGVRDSRLETVVEQLK